VRQSETGVRGSTTSATGTWSSRSPAISRSGPGFRWMTLGEIHRLLAVDDLVNMDARTVLSCLPFAGLDLDRIHRRSGDDLHTALVRSCSEESGSLPPDGRHPEAGSPSGGPPPEITTTLIPLGSIRGWHRDAARIRHESGLFFDVMGVRSHRGRPGGRPLDAADARAARDRSGSRSWSARSAGVLHVLVARHGWNRCFVDVRRSSPPDGCSARRRTTTACRRRARPPFLDEVLRAGGLGGPGSPPRLSEEGGRFYHARQLLPDRGDGPRPAGRAPPTSGG